MVEPVLLSRWSCGGVVSEMTSHGIIGGHLYFGEAHQYCHIVLSNLEKLGCASFLK